MKMASAGANSHGKSTSARTFAASWSNVPQVGTDSGKPKPTYDSVASATTNPGISVTTSAETTPAAAGSKWRKSTRAGPAPSDSAAIA